MEIHKDGFTVTPELGGAPHASTGRDLVELFWRFQWCLGVSVDIYHDQMFLTVMRMKPKGEI